MKHPIAMLETLVASRQKRHFFRPGRNPIAIRTMLTHTMNPKIFSPSPQFAIRRFRNIPRRFPIMHTTVGSGDECGLSLL
jgi:hypothetical protein